MYEGWGSGGPEITEDVLTRGTRWTLGRDLRPGQRTFVEAQRPDIEPDKLYRFDAGHVIGPRAPGAVWE